MCSSSVCWETCEIFCVFFWGPKKKKQSKNEGNPGGTKHHQQQKSNPIRAPPCHLPLPAPSLPPRPSCRNWMRRGAERVTDYGPLPPMNMEMENGCCWKVTTSGGLWEEECIKPCLFSVQEPFNSKRFNKGLKGSRKGHKETLQKNSENLPVQNSPIISELQPHWNVKVFGNESMIVF